MITGNTIQQNQKPIAIFDSGVGGLSILKAVQQVMPQENLVYLADTQYTPYGEHSVEFINQRVLTIADFLVKKNIKLMVVACNTATAASIQLLREKYDIPIVGLEPALKPAAEFTRNKKVGVLATQATLESEKYLNLKERFSNEVEIIEKASSLFVKLVESGETITSPHIELIKDELNIFIEHQIDSLVLGCTHFPFLTESIQAILGTQVTLFESAQPVAHEIKRQLGKNLNCNQEKTWVNYFSSNPKKAKEVFGKTWPRFSSTRDYKSP